MGLRPVACLANRCASSVKPRRRTATVGTTGTPSACFKRRRIKHQPVALGQIDHVERNHRRAPQRENFLCKDQVLLQVRASSTTTSTSAGPPGVRP
jgi:hypothetical protein